MHHAFIWHKHLPVARRTYYQKSGSSGNASALSPTPSQSLFYPFIRVVGKVIEFILYPIAIAVKPLLVAVRILNIIIDRLAFGDAGRFLPSNRSWVVRWFR